MTTIIIINEVFIIHETVFLYFLILLLTVQETLIIILSCNDRMRNFSYTWREAEGLKMRAPHDLNKGKNM